MEPESLASLNDHVRAGRIPLYHGGFPGLKVGDAVIPPSESGVPSMRRDSEWAGFTRITSSDALVYVTTERWLANAAAAYWPTRAPSNGRGWLYRVELDEHDLVPDDDLPRGPFISFQLARARVAAVLDRGVDPNDPRHRRKMEQFISRLR